MDGIIARIFDKKIYCKCRKPDDGSWMIQCNSCMSFNLVFILKKLFANLFTTTGLEWFHGRCIKGEFITKIPLEGKRGMLSLFCYYYSFIFDVCNYYHTSSCLFFSQIHYDINIISNNIFMDLNNSNRKFRNHW